MPESKRLRTLHDIAMSMRGGKTPMSYSNQAAKMARRIKVGEIKTPEKELEELKRQNPDVGLPPLGTYGWETVEDQLEWLKRHIAEKESNKRFGPLGPPRRYGGS